MTSLKIDAVEALQMALKRGERRLFSDVSFRLAAGEAVALTGANGAGKTSFLRAIAGLLRPESGEVRFLAQSGDVLDPEDVRARDLHLIGHQDGLKAGRSAGDELNFQGRWTGADADGLSEAISRLGLKPLLDLQVRQLSAGQRRRLALARLIAAPRSLWLLDEPLSPLDSVRRVRVGELMAEHLAAGGLILAAVHDPLPIAARALRIGAEG